MKPGVNTSSVAKDNLKQTEEKVSCIKAKRNNEYLSQAAFPYNGQAGVGHATQT